MYIFLVILHSCTSPLHCGLLKLVGHISAYECHYKFYLESDVATYPYVDNRQNYVSEVDKYLTEHLRDLWVLVVYVVMETFVDEAPT